MRRLCLALVFANAWGLALAGCSSDGKECIPRELVYCQEGTSYWVDSCGEIGDVFKQCTQGCNLSRSGCAEDDLGPACTTAANCPAGLGCHAEEGMCGPCRVPGECRLGESCIDGSCSDTCMLSTDCNLYLCTAGRCAPCSAPDDDERCRGEYGRKDFGCKQDGTCAQVVPCANNQDCASGYRCHLIDHVCVEDDCIPQCEGSCCGYDGCPGFKQCPNSCPAGMVCDPNFCWCIPDCPIGESCEVPGYTQGYLDPCGGDYDLCRGGLRGEFVCLWGFDPDEEHGYCFHLCEFPGGYCADGGTCAPTWTRGLGWCEPPGSNDWSELCRKPFDNCRPGLNCLQPSYDTMDGFCSATCDCHLAECDDPAGAATCLWPSENQDTCYCLYLCDVAQDCPASGVRWRCEANGSGPSVCLPE